MIVGAFDIAGRASGVAIGDAGSVPHFETLRQELDGDEFGPVGTKMRFWVIGLIVKYRPRHIAFEAPWVPSGSRDASRPTNTRIPRVLIGLAFEIEQIADEFGITSSERSPQSVRKHFVGHGRPENPKAAVMARCRQLGWPIRNDHEADAGALWSFTQSVLDPSFAYKMTPMFARVAG